MAYIFEKEINRYFMAAYGTGKESRKRSAEHWERYINIAKANKDFDLVIYAAEHLAAVKAADTIAEYVDNALVHFDTEGGLYWFSYFDADTEYFKTFRAAAEFAKYNLEQMEG